MMQGARNNEGSPSAMDESSPKKARLDLPNGHVKEEEVVVQEAAGGAVVRLDMRLLHCPRAPARSSLPSSRFFLSSTRAVKIDYFPLPRCRLACRVHCNGGHLACGVCVAAVPGGLRQACDNADGGGVFSPCPALDTVVSSARVACPHDGCGRYVVYHEAGEHQNACPHAPCHCTEPGCAGFAASPAALAGHLANDHAVPIQSVKYGRANRFQVPASVPRLLLVAEDGARVFLLTVGALGGSGASAVAVVCVGAARPRLTCKMWVNLEPPENGGGKSDIALVEMRMRSSTSPGAVVPADEPSFLAVPRTYLVPGPDDSPSMEVLLNVRIDEVSPS